MLFNTASSVTPQMLGLNPVPEFKDTVFAKRKGLKTGTHLLQNPLAPLAEYF
jgi:hypothetical protein